MTKKCKTIPEIITDPSKYVDVPEEVNILKEGQEVRKDIVTKLKKVMRDNNLVALSAPAIGFNKKIFCIAFEDSEIKTFINPVMTVVNSQPHINIETCTSLPGKKFLVPRFAEVSLTYQNPRGQIFSKKFIGGAAFVIQHEMWHMDSILLNDFCLEVDDDFFKASEEEKEEIVKMFLDSLDYTHKEIIAAIQESPEEKETYDAIKFLQGVVEGTVTVEKDKPNEQNNTDNTTKENE